MYLARCQDWCSAAAEVRRLFPEVTIVLKVDGDASFSTRGYPSCDIVSFTTRPGVIPRWSAFDVTQASKSTKISASIRELEQVLALLNHFENKAGTELVLQVRSSYLSTPSDVQHPDTSRQKKYKASMQVLAPLVAQLDSVDNLPDILTHGLDLCNVRLLVFVMPSDAHQVDRHKEALKHLPSLREVSLLTKFASCCKHVSAVLDVLSILPNIKVLRVATYSHFHVSATALQHVTFLELGKSVHCVLPLPTLISLSLLNLQDEPARCTFWQEVQRQNSLLCLSVQSFVPSSLSYLPAHLHSLTLTQAFEEEDLQPIESALSGLSSLRVLRIGNFLTTSIVEMLSELHLPCLHTLGFHVHYGAPGLTGHNRKIFDGQITHIFSLAKGVLQPFDVCSTTSLKSPVVWIPPDSVRGLAAAFPLLMCMEVCAGLLGSSREFIPRLKLDCAFLSQDDFPKLRGITSICCIQDAPLQLRAVPPSCYAVYKTSAMH